MAIPVLSLVIYRDADPESKELAANGVASGVLKLDPALDARVALLATAELAKLSGAYRADLEATNHFIQHLEKVTRNITDQLVIPDDLAALDVTAMLPRPDAKRIADQVLADHHVSEGTVGADEVYGMLLSAVHLARR